MATIFPLSEGLFTVGHDKQLVPFNEATDQLNERPIGSLLVEIQPFLVKVGAELIILDTGLGLKDESGTPMIHKNLQQHGFQPEQVTKVLLSHLHKDHAGGIVFTGSDGIWRTTFPNAEYYIYRNEADYALKTGMPSYDITGIEPLFTTPQINWLDGESGYIDINIQFFHSGGHCPEHIVFLIRDTDDPVFYGGDEAPQLKQMKMNYIAKYDFDGKKALALRKQYAEQGKKDHWQFLFYHDATNPVATL